MTARNHFLADFAIRYIVAFLLVSAASFAVVLRYHSAALNLIVARYLAIALACARDTLFAARIGCAVARFILNPFAPAFAGWVFAWAILLAFCYSAILLIVNLLNISRYVVLSLCICSCTQCE
jgi:hypothetical protein